MFFSPTAASLTVKMSHQIPIKEETALSPPSPVNHTSPPQAIDNASASRRTTDSSTKTNDTPPQQPSSTACPPQPPEITTHPQEPITTSTAATPPIEGKPYEWTTLQKNWHGTRVNAGQCDRLGRHRCDRIRDLESFVWKLVGCASGVEMFVWKLRGRRFIGGGGGGVGTW